jgi:enediyne biosynthesis protein E5
MVCLHMGRLADFRSRLAQHVAQTRPFWLDARHYQIAALTTLVIFNIGWIDFGANPLNSVLALAVSLLTQVVCSRLAGIPLDLRSPLITGLSLSLLLRADEPWLHAVAGVIAIASKFIFRIDGKHIWNPAGFAIVVLLYTAKSHVWISPGAWGSNVWFASLLVFFAILVLGAARRSDIALFFIGAHAALLLARALWLGDPLTIPLHQLQSGSLLIFTFFMISDPRTSPDSRLGRFIFAASVALLGHYMAFFMQMRPALYIALILLAPTVFLIDRLLPAERFAWRGPLPQGADR